MRGSVRQRCWFFLIIFSICKLALAAPAVPVFGPATIVSELALPSSQDVAQSISRDGTSLFFNSLRNGGHYELFVATRAGSSGSFTNQTQTPFLGLNNAVIENGVISADQLSLYYTVPNAGKTTMYQASRAAINAPFANPQQIPSTSGAGYSASFISDDGKRLYLSTPGIMYVATANASGVFGTPSSSPFVNFPYTEDFYLTPDELQIYASTSAGMQWSWRPDLNTPFVAPQPITSINNNGGGYAPVVNGNTIYFTRPNYIWQATQIPEPVGACGLVLGFSFVSSRRRRKVKNQALAQPRS